jgi:acetyl esterase/lipase
MPRLASSPLRAHAGALPILATTLSLPGAAALLRFGKQPTSSETTVAGVSTTVVRPPGPPPWPALVFMNGATPHGRTHPTVRRLSLALARAGVVTFVPDLSGVAEGELSPATLAQAVGVAEAAARSPETADERVAVAGVSIGGTLALLAAADARLRRLTSVVVCVAPYADLAEVMRLATTGTYRQGGGLLHRSAPASLHEGLQRSLSRMLGTAATRDEAKRVGALLANTDPGRFDALYDALPMRVRAAVLSLSPLRSADRLCAPVEIATAPHDKYFPIAEARALASASPHVRVTVTSLLAHATLRPDPRYVGELSRLYGFFVRAFTAATRASPADTQRSRRPPAAS